jgi:hypothetical protein
MPVSYNAALKQDRMNAITEHIDDAATEGYIEITTAADTTFATPLVTIDLQDPSFGTASAAGVITMEAPAGGLSGVATATGTAAIARICDGDDVAVVTGLVVGTAIAPGVEIALSALAISSGQTVTLTAGTITHAA